MSNSRKWLRKDSANGVEYPVTRRDMEGTLRILNSWSIKEARAAVDRAVLAGGKISAENVIFRLGAP